jgi:hypothetical protein
MPNGLNSTRYHPLLERIARKTLEISIESCSQLEPASKSFPIAAPGAEAESPVLLSKDVLESEG